MTADTVQIDQLAPASDRLIRSGAYVMVTLLFLFLINVYLTHWQNWPTFAESVQNLSSSGLSLIHFGLFTTIIIAAFIYPWLTPKQGLQTDAERFSRLSAFVIRAAFWSVFLIGFVDSVISFLRVENLLASIVGEELNVQLGRAIFRGTYVHYPLVVLSLLIAAFTRSISVIWLVFLVVISEFSIVLSSFVFSYEQAFMGDLVRFWYAALFLFVSAYTLVEEGHVRVDVLYAHFSDRGKAWANTIGCLLLGLPLCWTILTQGMWNKGSSLISPIISFEISQSGYGLYVKYLMASFLTIFAVSMAIQFVAYILESVAILKGYPVRHKRKTGGTH